jgi:hypothetical protein
MIVLIYPSIIIHYIEMLFGVVMITLYNDCFHRPIIIRYIETLFGVVMITLYNDGSHIPVYYNTLY